jgi:hypothetical protein
MNYLLNIVKDIFKYSFVEINSANNDKSHVDFFYNI